jgi:DNA invertase Pin-like site-specific DNA recombinase
MPAREKLLRDLAAKLGWQVHQVVIENDVVEGDGRRKPASAFKRKVVALPGGRTEKRVYRPGFRSVLDNLMSGAAQAVLAEDLDRAFRDPRDLEDFIDVCEDTGANARSLSGSLTMTNGGTDAEITMARMLVTMANKSSRDTSRRVKAARKLQREAGTFGGGIRPYGFRTTDKPGVLAEVDAEVAELDRMVVDVAAGRTLWAIAHQLNERKVATVKGGPWTPESVRSVILRERTGDLVSDRAAWEAACEILRNPARRVGPGSKAQHLLSGILRCGVCGGPMSVQRCRGAYLCRRGGHTRIDQGRTDQEVTATVVTRLAQPDAASLLARPDGTGSDLAALVTEAGKLRQRKSMLAGLLAAGEMDADEWSAASKVVKDKLAALEARLAAAAQAIMDAPAAALAGREDATGLWSKLNLEARRSIIRSLVTITIARQGRGRLPGGAYTRWNPDRIMIKWRGEQTEAAVA